MVEKLEINDTKSTTDPGVILSNLFIQILKDLGFNRLRFEKQLDKYFLRSHKHYAKKSTYTQTKNKSTIKNKLLTKKMTWKTYLFGLYDFLSVKMVIFNLEMVRNDQKLYICYKIHTSFKLKDIVDDILLWLGVYDDEDLLYLVKQYQEKQKQGVYGEEGKKKEKSQILKKIGRDTSFLKNPKKDITWKSFIFTLFEFFSFEEIIFNFELTHSLSRGEHNTTHQVSLVNIKKEV